ncbi:MAG: glycosyltransferase [Nitrospirae bacterium]|nr:glycosyltransferase [Nitrospirota bacterium]
MSIQLTGRQKLKSKPVRVLYQPYTDITQGPFKYIESGYIRGFERAGCEVVVWLGNSADELRSILASFKPDLFIGYLRRPGDFLNYEWMSGEMFELLLEHRRKHGMKTAMHTHPDVQRLVEHMHLEFQPGDPSQAGNFYTQPPPPTAMENILVSEKFIDLILHPYSRGVGETCFNFWVSHGVSILDEPLAADDAIYRKSYLPRFKKYDISYIGGWWPFKGIQMDRHLFPLKDRFGERLSVFGRAWPHLSAGPVSDDEYRGIVWKSRVNLVFHEPSQVQGVAVHVNERIFKLYAMGAFAVCDNNPCLREYFDDDEIVIAENPADMVEKCVYYLGNDVARKRIAENGHKAVLNRHTYLARARKLLKVLSVIN